MKFSDRHIGPSFDEQRKMLNEIGVSSIQELVDQTLPSQIKLDKKMDLPKALSESRFIEHLYRIGKKNKNYRSYIGLGYYNTILPGVIQRNVLENPGWYTAYTPYQPEIAQGRLEALLNYQTMVCDLTAMDLANASLLDEATAASEAMVMLYNSRDRQKKKSNCNKFFVSSDCFPQTISLLETRSEPLGIDLVISSTNEVEIDESFFGSILQYPNKNGAVLDSSDFISKLKKFNIGLVVAADLLSLTLLKPPGEWGADVVVGTTQRFGIPLGYGGPHAAYFATKEIYKRSIPGRIIGVSQDIDENKALRMALQTREQHIKRERATSNICTAQVLLAVMAGMYSVYHGPSGLKSISNKIHRLTLMLSEGLKQLGFLQRNNVFFDTLHINVGNISIENIRTYAEVAKINFNYIDDKNLTISIDEKDDEENIADILDIFARSCKHSDSQNLINELPNIRTKSGSISESIFERKSEFLSHPVFNSYHSETALMRYIKSLENKDLSLTKSMIPLGSCTMKLNSATELFALSWPSFSNLHPFAPLNQTRGYSIMFHELEEMLCEITGFDAMSLQPNSGAQGEYAGLMVIREYHKNNGDSNRNICLIPSSAHGTNPASAVMAGMKVVVVKCDEKGNIDFEDLKQKAEEHTQNLAALMITYPSTHGVFEEKIIEINNTIHENGGQVYMDGANMNAQVGLTNPAIIGADVCHLNLHKTFAIPHGGGGPGMGPIGVKKHLKNFLPTNPIIKVGGKKPIKAISAAPWGSASILTISYAYIKMLGEEGLRQSTEIAILNANYIKKKLESSYNILYLGEKNRVGHEMIIDCRPFKALDIEVSDIAKRLMDYGFHAPTVSFPVAGTMMIEPTESENLEEINRFCEAMISIKNEINEIAEGIADKVDNVIKNSPHTINMLTSEEWNHSYSREKAAFPIHWVRQDKFWPSVRRVNESYGDRNLICSCIPIEEYN